MRTSIAYFPYNNRSLLKFAFRSADIIPSPTYERSQPKLSLHTIPFQVRLRHRINDDDEAYNTALLPFWPFRTLRLFRQIEDPAQSTSWMDVAGRILPQNH
jgi:hypothetical protein